MIYEIEGEDDPDAGGDCDQCGTECKYRQDGLCEECMSKLIEDSQ